MPRPIAVLLVVCLMAATGCNEEFSRYPSVNVPEYTQEDYVRDLSDPNPEVVYNAVCNLGAVANEAGKALGGEKTDPNSAPHRSAQDVYRKILGLLQHRDPQVVAASLRFLELFSAEYKPKAELIAPISRIQSGHPLVQFEQVSVLSGLVTNTTRLPEPLLRRLLESRSWIVSRSAYQLVNRLEDEPLRQELVRRYRATGDEKEKLLLLTAFSQHPGPVETALLEQEALAATSAKLRHTALVVLGENIASGQLVNWLGEHDAQLRPEDRTWLFNVAAGLETEFAADLVCQSLKHGFVPGDEFLQKLSDRLDAEQESGSQTPHLARVEETMRAVPSLAGRWQKLRAETKLRRDGFAALQKEYAPLAEEFVQKAQALMARHDVPAAKQQEFFKSITDLKRLEAGKD